MRRVFIVVAWLVMAAVAHAQSLERAPRLPKPYLDAVLAYRRGDIGAMDEMRARYLVSFYPEGVRHGGWHALKVSVNVPGSVTARPGYFGSARN